MSQGDWLEHARRHLDRATWHRERGDYELARTELAGAISDIWAASDEIGSEQEEPRLVHGVNPQSTLFAPCGEFITHRGEWRQLTRTTSIADDVTCPGCRAGAAGAA